MVNLKAKLDALGGIETNEGAAYTSLDALCPEAFNALYAVLDIHAGHDPGKCPTLKAIASALGEVEEQPS